MSASEIKAKRPAQPKGLTPERIFVAAAEIIDQGNLDALTMRSLAQRLKVSPTAIYWHVRTREDLLKGVYDHVLARRYIPADDAGIWSDRIKDFCRELRKLMVAHPFLFTLSQRFPGRSGAESIHFLMNAAREAGYDGVEAFEFAQMFDLYTVGFAFVESSSYLEPSHRQAHVSRLLAEMSPEMLPLLPLMMGTDADRLFERGLAALIQGVTRVDDGTTTKPEPND